ncbi:MAG: cobalamin B12-binding domain-containing protein [Deltaproteobacteria bacterium]|nr:cobalamin B12-binding domain-containing protein [Deltaproteobacteria bacterium]
MKRRIRVLIAKPGLDGHDRGAKVVAYALRDAGFEVIFSGLRQRPEKIVNTAIQEAVDVIGLSILSGAHLSLTRRVLDALEEKGAGDIIVLVGGVIPGEDIPTLKKWGVREVFTSGAGVDRIIETIREAADTRYPLGNSG